MHPTKLNRVAGFTLLELVVSLAIITILMMIVFVRGSAQVQSARASAFIDQLRVFEGNSRTIARQQNVVVNQVFDLRERQLQRKLAAGKVSRTLRFPVAIQELEVRMDRRWQAIGKPVVEINSAGRSTDFAIRFVAAGRKNRTYLAVVGQTGQVVSLDSEEELHALFNPS